MLHWQIDITLNMTPIVLGVATNILLWFRGRNRRGAQ